jgi:hypothetical protein
LRDLNRAGATLVDPGPEGALFTDALAEILPALDAGTLAAVFNEAFPPGTDLVAASIGIAGNAAKLPPDLTLRVIAEREPPTQGEVLFALNRYLRERGDKNIGSVADLIAKSTFFRVAPIDGVAAPANVRLEKLKPLASQRGFVVGEAGDVPTRAVNPRDEAAGDGVGHGHKDDWDHPRLSLEGSGRHVPAGQDDVGLQTDQLLRERSAVCLMLQ